MICLLLILPAVNFCILHFCGQDILEELTILDDYLVLSLYYEQATNVRPILSGSIINYLSKPIFKAEMYPVDIQVRDLEKQLSGELGKSGFRKVPIEEVHSLDRNYLERRDRRDFYYAVGLTPDEKWRPAEDYLLFDNPEGTLAYVRPNPYAPKIYYVLPFEIHLRTAAPRGFSSRQYFSLAFPQKNLSQLLEAIQGKGDNSISAIADMGKLNVLRRIPEQIDEIDEADKINELNEINEINEKSEIEDTSSDTFLPVHLFHSIYISRTREEEGGYSNKEKAVEELSKAISSVIIDTHLFSREQIAYYQATAKVGRLFLDSALVD